MNEILPNVDNGLHEVVTKISYGTLKANSLCIMDGSCSKLYPRALVSNTNTEHGISFIQEIARIGKLASLNKLSGDNRGRKIF